MKIKTRNGQPYLWLALILGIIVIGWVIALVGYPLYYVHNHVAVDPVINGDTEIETFFIRSQTVWVWLPLAGILCLALYIIIQIHKKRNYGGLV